MSLAHTLNTGAFKGAQAGLVLVFFAFPMSVALANVALLLTLLLWALSLGGAASRAALREAFRNPLVGPALALFAWIVIAVAWSPADREGVTGFVQKYLKFAMIPVFIALLQDARVRRRCWQAFAVALLFTLAVTWLNVWFDFSWTRTHNQGFGQDHTVFKDYISQGLMMSVFAVGCAFLALEQRDSRRAAALWLLWALASASVLILSLGRTGYLAWAASTAVFGLTWALGRSRRTALVTLVVLGGLFAAAVSSPLLQQRGEVALEEASTAGQGAVTSIGARVAMARFVLQAVPHAPLLGHGTASYPVGAKQHFTAPGYCEVVCPHPHNQFLFFLYEQGAIGLLLFLAFIAVIVREAWRHEPRRRALALAFVATLCAACVSHSSFWLSTENHCLILMSALVMAGLYARRTSIDLRAPEPGP
ncbi:O-antigen ligase family protein [Hydrogenophaga crocea]|uniref:O-antigen ligase family protein n=1 Tax=Hydrogenophaga crocea TaxID=2716225 RepID=A0A6G8ICV5_9BURK|nr:O-antigen ligase family protein [Hydrogenophaga crocea]QIM50963.1 O-antigen ligase family protein [Hydrogenophaga crocea]